MERVKATTAKSSSPVVIPDRMFFRIGEVAELLGVKTHVLRYWETEFPMVVPKKSGSGHRVYQKPEVETLALIQKLLYEERFSIEGARRFLKQLRQEGSLKSARQRMLAPAGGTTAPTATTVAVGELAQELKKLALTPITEFFRY